MTALAWTLFACTLYVLICEYRDRRRAEHLARMWRSEAACLARQLRACQDKALRRELRLSELEIRECERVVRRICMGNVERN